MKSVPVFGSSLCPLWHAASRSQPPRPQFPITLTLSLYLKAKCQKNKIKCQINKIVSALVLVNKGSRNQTSVVLVVLTRVR